MELHSVATSIEPHRNMVQNYFATHLAPVWQALRDETQTALLAGLAGGIAILVILTLFPGDPFDYGAGDDGNAEGLKKYRDAYERARQKGEKRKGVSTPRAKRVYYFTRSGRRTVASSLSSVQTVTSSCAQPTARNASLESGFLERARSWAPRLAAKGPARATVAIADGRRTSHARARGRGLTRIQTRSERRVSVSRGAPASRHTSGAAALGDGRDDGLRADGG